MVAHGRVMVAHGRVMVAHGRATVVLGRIMVVHGHIIVVHGFASTVLNYFIALTHRHRRIKRCTYTADAYDGGSTWPVMLVMKTNQYRKDN